MKRVCATCRAELGNWHFAGCGHDRSERLTMVRDEQCMDLEPSPPPSSPGALTMTPDPSSTPVAEWETHSLASLLNAFAEDHPVAKVREAMVEASKRLHAVAASAASNRPALRNETPPRSGQCDSSEDTARLDYLESLGNVVAGLGHDMKPEWAKFGWAPDASRLSGEPPTTLREWIDKCRESQQTISGTPSPAPVGATPSADAVRLRGFASDCRKAASDLRIGKRNNYGAGYLAHMADALDRIADRLAASPVGARTPDGATRIDWLDSDADIAEIARKAMGDPQGFAFVIPGTQFSGREDRSDG